jgi:hypothetical protein
MRQHMDKVTLFARRRCRHKRADHRDDFSARWA